MLQQKEFEKKLSEVHLTQQQRHYVVSGDAARAQGSIVQALADLLTFSIVESDHVSGGLLQASADLADIYQFLDQFRDNPEAALVD